MTALLVLAALTAAFAAGCGGDDEPKIPRQNAADIRAELLLAKRRLSPLRCDDLSTQSIPDLEDQVAELPEDSDVRNTLEDGIDHLRSLVEAECAARDEEKDETTTTTEPETTTAPPETTTAPPETTTPPETTPPETTPPDGPEPDPDPDPDPGGDGNGGQGVPQGAVRPREKRVKKDKG